MGATKKQFLAAYREALATHADPLFAWAKDEAKLDRFMRSVEETITSQSARWNHDSPVARSVFCKLTSRPSREYSRTALRNLPEA